MKAVVVAKILQKELCAYGILVPPLASSPDERKKMKFNSYILGQKSNGPLQTMDCKMPPVWSIFINRISHSSAASARQY